MNKYSGDFSQQGSQEDVAALATSSRIVEVSRYLAFARWLALGAAAFVCISVFFGIRSFTSGAGGLSGWVIPLTIAVAVGMTLGGAWHMVLGLAARPATRPYHIPLVILVGLFLTGLQIGTSGWFLATQIGGTEALQVHFNEVLAQAAEALNVLRGQAEAQRPVLGLLSDAERQLTALQACEQASGCVSGTPGRGAVYSQLGNAISALSSKADDVRTALDRLPALLVEAERHLSIARQAIRHGEADVFGDAINAAIAGLNAAASSDVGSHLRSFSTGVAIPEVNAVTGRLASQITAAAGISNFVRLPDYAPMSEARAVLEYSSDVAGAWIISICVDFITFGLLLLVLYAAHMQMKDDEDIAAWDAHQSDLSRRSDNLDDQLRRRIFPDD